MATEDWWRVKKGEALGLLGKIFWEKDGLLGKRHNDNSSLRKVYHIKKSAFSISCFEINTFIYSVYLSNFEIM